ncbi:hypothetical protein BDZ45DRAFT_686570 [Acephala macrosclerotiorum]|nr:hypothetical protein BDZ45DRAFT_686570 [Acephala macrosclerotiorum]
MRFSNFSPIIFLLGRGLAHNETGPGGRFWNTTTAHPAPTSSGFFANTSSIEEVATIKIQIGNLSGSGVINLSNVATPSEAAQLSDLLDPTSFINQPHQTEANSSLSTFCPPNTTAAFPYRSTSARYFNATVGGPTAQPSVGPIPLTSRIFTGSGSYTSTGLLKLPAVLSAFIIQIAMMSLV